MLEDGFMFYVFPIKYNQGFNYQKYFICEQCERMMILTLYSFTIWKILQIENNNKYVHFLFFPKVQFKRILLL